MKKPRPPFRLEDLLLVFRAVETQEGALIVLGDEEAMRVLIAWGNTDHVWKHPGRTHPEPMPGKMAKLWSWIMMGWDVDSRKVSRLAGVTPGVAHAKLEILMGNRLIYPDGTMSKGTRTALMAHTAKMFGIKQKAAAPPMPTKKKNKDDDDDEDGAN